jgi:hypothetical protein
VIQGILPSTAAGGRAGREPSEAQYLGIKVLAQQAFMTPARHAL